MRFLDEASELGDDLWCYETRVSPLGTLEALPHIFGNFFFRPV